MSVTEQMAGTMLPSENLPIEARFIKLMARRLHEYGAGAHRLETAVSNVAEQLGIRCSVFSSPTSIFITFSGFEFDEDDLVLPAQLIRVSPGDMDIGRLTEVDSVSQAVADGELQVEVGVDRLKEIAKRSPIFGLPIHLLAWAATGMAVTSMLKSSWTDIVIASMLGVLTGIMSMRWGKRLQTIGSFEPIIAAMITVLAYLLSALLGGSQVPHIVIGALIILMPGLNLTLAITELATGHLSSGTSRFAGASVVLIKLALGVVLATQAMTALGFDTDGATTVLAPDWFIWLSVLVAGFSFAILFGILIRDLPVVIFTAVSTFALNFYVSSHISPNVGIFLASLYVASASNLFSRLTNRPAVIMRMPGIILLVPGSLGYRAMTLLFSDDMDAGLSSVVGVATVLACLVGGLLLGNTLIAPRRSL